MQVKVTHGRGIGIEIDGQQSAARWSVGDHEFGLTCHENLESDRGVAIGEHRVLGIEYDKTMDSVSEGTEPTTMTLVTEAGRTKLKVTRITDNENDCNYAIEAQTDNRLN